MTLDGHGLDSLGGLEDKTLVGQDMDSPLAGVPEEKGSVLSDNPGSEGLG